MSNKNVEGWENGNPIPRNSYRNSYRSSHKRNAKTSDTIILNVGGIKYVTTRTTLTGYPETMLAKMFDPTNAAMLKPTYPDGNEYFIDRNGYAFYYIMEFYRNGQILWSNRNACSCKSSKVFVSEQDLQQEIEYFQIPYFARQIDLALKYGAKLVDEFGDSLEALLIEAISIVVNRIEINFGQSGHDAYLIPSINEHNNYEGICGKFKTSGYGILECFSAMLEKRIKTQFPSCHWETKNHKKFSVPNIKLILSGFIDINSVMSHVRPGRD